MYLEGQRVRMSSQGRNTYSHSDSNPHDMEGVVHNARPSLIVRWDNGYTNTYGRGDLDVIDDPPNSVVLRVAVSARDDQSCRPNCRLCQRVCPNRAIQRRGSNTQISTEYCDGCGLCIEVCPIDRLYWRKIVVIPEDTITEDQKVEVSKLYSDAPRNVRKAREWRSKFEDVLKTHAEQLAQAINSDSEADLYASAVKLCEIAERTPRKQLSEAATTVGAGFSSPRKAAEMEIEGILRLFDHVSFRGKELTVITKGDMIAREVNFGKFKIKLHLPDGGLLVSALDPNWGDDRELASHPHVDRDAGYGGVCLGEGKEAFIKATMEGRICDALLIVQGVLNEYGGNPHHSISSWTGKECFVCGGRGAKYDHQCVMRMRLCVEHAMFCSHCGKVICPICTTTCETCGTHLCRVCAKRGVCEHKGDTRNNNAESIIDFFKEKYPGRFNEFTRISDQKAQDTINIIEEASKVKAQVTKEEDARREAAKVAEAQEQEIQRLRAMERARWDSLDHSGRDTFMAGHETEEGHAGFLGDEAYSDMVDRYAPEENPEEGDDPEETERCDCGNRICRICGVCHECYGSGEDDEDEEE